LANLTHQIIEAIVAILHEAGITATQERPPAASPLSDARWVSAHYASNGREVRANISVIGDELRFGGHCLSLADPKVFDKLVQFFLADTIINGPGCYAEERAG